MSDPPTAVEPGTAPGAPDPTLVAGVATFADMANAGAACLAAVTLADGTPRATRAWSCEVVDVASHRIRVAVGAHDASLVEALRAGIGRVAVTAADVATLVSIQVKGPVVAVELFLDAICGTGRRFALPVPPTTSTVDEAQSVLHGGLPASILRLAADE